MLSSRYSKRMCGRSNESNKLNLLKIYNFIDIDDGDTIQQKTKKRRKHINVYRGSHIKKEI